jgi:hypothetical protein
MQKHPGQISRALCGRLFAPRPEEQTNIGGDAAIDLAGVLAEYARSRVLEIRDDDKAKDFSLMSALGWFEVGKITEGKRR